MAVAKDGFAARYNMTHKEVNEGEKFFILVIYLSIFFLRILEYLSKSFPPFFLLPSCGSFPLQSSVRFGVGKDLQRPDHGLVELLR